MRNVLERTGPAGFTLIELLVVIAIISIAVTASTVMLINVLESRGLRENGQIFTTVFNQARQLAQSKGADHFVIIRNETKKTPAKFLIVQDLNGDGVPREYSREPNLDAGEDLLVDEFEISNMIDVRVGDENGAGPLVEGEDSNQEYWIRFGADGTINGGSFSPENPRIAYRLNRTWRETNQPPNLNNERHDFLMTRKSGEKLFFDWEPAVGKIVTTYFTH